MKINEVGETKRLMSFDVSFCEGSERGDALKRIKSMTAIILY